LLGSANGKLIAKANAHVEHFYLLAVERWFDHTAMKSGQELIAELLNYQNWNNGTAEYMSHIHLLSMYDYNDLAEECKPFYCGESTKANVQDEIVDFLGDASGIGIFYYIGHGSGDGAPALHLDDVISETELTGWLPQFPEISIVVILDTCHSGSWINDGAGGLLCNSRCVLAACESDQTAKGWYPPNNWGWFTHEGVIPGFSTGDDSDSNGWIDAAECFVYAQPATQAYAAAQSSVQDPVSCYAADMIAYSNGKVPLVQRDETMPKPVIPEVPLGTAMTLVACLCAFSSYIFAKKHRIIVA
jgi:hypothetical protein